MLRSLTVVALSALAGTGCGADAASDDGAKGHADAEIGAVAQAQTALDKCYSDVRVTSGLVSLEVCAGARVFFDETFNGNGRTCATCHRVENSYTIDPAFIATLDANDPLFVAETNPALGDLEGDQLRSLGVIKENVDGFEDLTHKFTLRSVPHLLSMARTIERDPSDGTSSNFVERTGWSGDGVEGGALRDFVDGAIRQHYPKDLSRQEGPSFRLASEQELDQLLAFQLALGRLNELDILTMKLNDPGAEQGRLDFISPSVGRCNECHANGGSNSLDTGKNTNFNTDAELLSGALHRPTFDGVTLEDGGFGGQGLASPNFPEEAPVAFGDGTFNTPSIIEAADTGPFFHNNGAETAPGITGLLGVVAFYAQGGAFENSPAAEALEAKFLTPIGPLPLVEIAQFLRVLNAAFNLGISIQRLEAAELLNMQYWGYQASVQVGLINLAAEELDDAIRVLQANDSGPMYQNEVALLIASKADLSAAAAESNPAVRLTHTRDALSKIRQAKSGFGSNLDFEMGEGNLMF